jgi:hypothetical protein
MSVRSESYVNIGSGMTVDREAVREPYAVNYPTLKAPKALRAG